MDNFVARANIDHFLDLLKRDGISGEERATVNKLLVQEEGRLSRNAEQLAFAETNVARYQLHFDNLTVWRDGFAEGSADREKADGIVASLEITLKLVEDFRDEMRRFAGYRSL